MTGDSELGSSDQQLDKLLGSAYESALGLGWDLDADDMLAASGRQRSGRVQTRIGVVLVAAAILVVFFVPLPRISLFNRLSHGSTVTPSASSTTSIPGSKGTTPLCSSLSLALGPDVSAANEEIPLMLALTNTGSRSCAISGYPSLVLLSGSGKRLGFTYSHENVDFLTSAPPRRVVVSPGARAYVLLAKFACQLGDKTVAARLLLTPPHTSKHLGLRVPSRPTFAYCKGGSGEVGDNVAVSPVEPAVQATLPGASAAPASTTTWWFDTTWVSSQMGWVLGEGQEGCPSCVVIRYTRDGGITWSALPVPAGMPRDLAPDSYGCLVHGCVSQIVFASPEDGYLFDPDLYTTSDGGATWHRQTGRPTIVLAKVAPGIVWRFTYTNLGCPGPCGLSLLQQMVGSATWTTVRAPFDGSGTGIVPQIVTTDSARVLIAFYGNIAGGVSSHATFYITANLGRSWTKRSDPCGWTKSNEVDAYDSSATPAGVVVVECLEKGDSSNTAFVTVSHDGAKSFGPRRAIPQSNAFMLAAVGAKTIVLASGGVGGAGPFTYMVKTSTNGGVAWRTVVRDREILSVGGYERAESYLGFVTSSFGHWIGYGNRLWTTTDGGEHWTASNVWS